MPPQPTRNVNTRWNKTRPSDNVKDSLKHTTNHYTTGKTLSATQR